MKTIYIYAFALFLFLGLFYVFIRWGKTFFLAIPWRVKDLVQAFKRGRKKQSKVFDLYGVHIFCGRVGCGKTISMLRRAAEIKARYPNVKIYSNFTTDIADGMINSWEDIINIENIDENGVNQGVLFLFDEIHLTFDSLGWRNAPTNLLEYISLQRHLHKCIFGASQVWSRVNKIIKEQTDYVIECKSFLGARLIENKCYTNENYQINGNMKESGQRKRPKEWKKCFVATDELRSHYDTDEIIGSLAIAPVSDTEKLQKTFENILSAAAKP